MVASSGNPGGKSIFTMGKFKCEDGMSDPLNGKNFDIFLASRNMIYKLCRVELKLFVM